MVPKLILILELVMSFVFSHPNLLIVLLVSKHKKSGMDIHFK